MPSSPPRAARSPRGSRRRSVRSRITNGSTGRSSTGERCSRPERSCGGSAGAATRLRGWPRRAIFGSLRSPLWLARVEAEERRLGGRRPANGTLTPTEARVAALAGQGLRNAEIAAQLFVSPKTVEATLSRVYRKVGVRSRTELAHRLAADRPGEIV